MHLDRGALRARARRAFGLAGLLALVPLGAGAQAPLRVESAGALAEVPAAGGLPFVGYPVRTLERAGAQVQEGPTGARVVLFGDTLEFDARSPFFRAAGTLEQLAFPAARRDGVLYLPRQLFVSWLPARYPSRVTWGDGVLRIAGVAPVAEAPAAAPVSPAKPAREVSRTRVVVLDAGHGGRDPGKVGPGGIREKDIVLSVVRRLEAELARRGAYEVHLTRTTDTLIALDDRPRMANDWKDGRPLALFVSVHANAHSSAARGFETFFLSEARTEDERRVAEMENEVVRYESERPAAQLDDLMLIASGLRNDFYLRASNGLAEVVQRNMAGFHPGPNRGVKQAAFRVLVGAVMPAVLVELAFISNRQEAALLASSSFQDKLAWSLANAIDEFFDKNERLWLAGSES